MAKSISPKTRERRARRKKVILFFYGLFNKIIGFFVINSSFKKNIIRFCIGYIIYTMEWVKADYAAMGIPVPYEIIVALITAFIVELGLTALTSIKEKDCGNCEYKQKVESTESEAGMYG